MGLKAGYKQTEVGMIPEDWEVKPLGAVVSFLDGKRRPVKDSDRTKMRGTFPYYGASGIVDYVNEFLFDDELILLGEDGENILSRNCRLAFRVSGKIWVNNHAHVLKPNADVSLGFLTDFLESLNYERFNSGTAQPKLNKQTCSSISVSLPPTKGEQEAIAEALSDADALIESLEQLIAKKRHFKQGTMQELLRPKDGWAWKTLGDLAGIQRGASPRPIDSPIWFDDNSSVGWVRISDVTRSAMYLRETTQRLSALGVQHSRPVSRGSLIMSICATVGRPIITEIDACIHDGFVVFDNLRADKHFMYYILTSIESDWSRHGQTGSQMNLNTGLIAGTRIAMPTPAEQTTIAAILSDMDAEIAALEARLAKARQVKQGMMQELLTGRIRLI